jgi:hypothetical protein
MEMEAGKRTVEKGLFYANMSCLLGAIDLQINSKKRRDAERNGRRYGIKYEYESFSDSS